MGRCSSLGAPGVTEESREEEDLPRSVRLELAEVSATAAERPPYVIEALPALRCTSEVSWRNQTCSSSSVCAQSTKDWLGVRTSKEKSVGTPG